MRFWAHFRLNFWSFLEQGGSSIFCNPSKQNHDFQGSRASIFQCFFWSFSTFHSGPHFSGFFGDFRVAKAPVLELVGLIFRHQKKGSKKGLRVFTSVREYWRGGIPLNKITDSFRNSFSTSVHSSGAWRHGGGLILHIGESGNLGVFEISEALGVHFSKFGLLNFSFFIS